MLQRANDDGHGTSLQYKIIVDSGCTYFVTPHKHYFLPNSLIPTTQTMVGVEGKPTPLLGEGIISITVMDKHERILHRITVPGLLSSTGSTLLSVEQIHRQDAVGYHRPTDDTLPFLFTGNIRNPVP